MSINSIRNLLEEACETSGNKIAVKFNNQSITYKELLDKVNIVAHYFSNLGFKKGSRIGIYSNKSIEQVIAILAILSTEYIFVPITKLLKPEQVQYIIDDCEIECIITDKAKLKNIKEIEFNGKIVTYESIDKNLVSFEELYKCLHIDYSCNIRGHNNAVITYSFATSGNPKGIVITHRNLTDGARVVSKYLQLKESDVISAVLSFNLDYGLNQLFCSLYKKATLAIHRFVLPMDFFTHIIRDEVTVLAVMPIHITQMFDEDRRRLPKPDDLKHVRVITSSGGKITNLMIKNIEEFYPNAKFYSMHGLTEAFRSAYLDPSQINIRPTSIGKAIPDVELYVVNDDLKLCKPREIGELVHRGACIYKGFWKAPNATKERFKSIKVLKDCIDLEGDLTDEIVVFSGDYVYKDEEGYIYFVSRKDDMINTRGYRISPYEIESVVNDYLGKIDECAVFSIANEKIEEEIVLVYSAKSEIPKNEIIFELKKHLAPYMIPSIIVYRKNLYHTSTHDKKIDKQKLKEEIMKIV